MAEPRVSVIIPSYNHSAYLGEAIASVQAQTLTDWELIVIDDGSRDDSLAIARSYARDDARIRVLAQANAGSHATMNRGIGLARAPCVAVLNSDDRFAPGRLARLWELSEAGHDFVVTAVRLIDAGGEPLRDPDHWWNRMYARFLDDYRANGALVALARGNFTVSTSNFFFRRDLFDTLGPLRHLRFVIDWDWALRVLLDRPDRFLFLADEVLLDYRLHETNTIHSNSLRAAMETSQIHWRALMAGAPEMAAALAAQRRRERYLRREAIAKREADWGRYLGELETALEVRAAEREAAQRRLEAFQREIFDSTTWRVGRVATAPFRWLKRRRARVP